MVLSTFDFPVVDVWANPVGDSVLPEARLLFEQSHVNPDLIARKLSPDELVAMMDAAGVDQICLTAWYRPGVAVFSNSEVADYTRAHPTRICGLASVDLLGPVAAVAELDHYVKREGFKGLRVVPWLWNLPPTDAHYWPLYVKCVELDRPIPYIDAVALKFPALKIVCGHIGHPWTAEMIAVAWKHGNVFIDTGAHLPKYYPPELNRFANTTGRKKVMFGTNFPQLTWAKCVNQAAEYLREGAVIGLRADAMKDFIGGNARRVFKLGDSSRKIMSASL